MALFFFFCFFFFFLNRCKHVRTFLIGYRSGGTPYVFSSRGVCGNCGPSMREQCLPVPRQPPGSSCCLSLLAGGFRPTTTWCWIDPLQDNVWFVILYVPSVVLECYTYW